MKSRNNGRGEGAYPMWCDLNGEIISGAVTFVTATFGVVAGALLSMWAYFRQKEFELVKERYLEGGLDVVASEVEQYLGVAKHNWARCLNILKAFRGERMEFNKEELTKGFLDLNMSHINRIAHHRIEGLVGHDGAQLIWTVYQVALAEAFSNNSVFTKEVPEVINKKLTTNLISKEPEEIVAELLPDLDERDEKSHRFANLTRCLFQLSFMLERERMTFKGLRNFKDRQRVRSVIAELAREFEKDVADAREELSSSNGNTTRPAVQQP